MKQGVTEAKKILLTIDVEDWFQVENLRPWFPPSEWDRHPGRVEQNTRRLLDLFDRFSQIPVKATFFVLGWVANRLPDIVREIHRRGHEVASHGYGHRMCDQLGVDELKEDLARSKALLEDITGCEVKGYRAPSFSINDQALKMIQAAGYAYDASYNNFSLHHRYGRLLVNHNSKKGVGFRFTDDFYELPISNLKLANQVIPWGGGGYFRLLPFPIFKTGIRQILRDKDAYVFYMHPWEIDPDQPRVNEPKGLSAWRHYMNLDKTYSRLARLISSFRHCDFITCRQYLEYQGC